MYESTNTTVTLLKRPSDTAGSDAGDNNHVKIGNAELLVLVSIHYGVLVAIL
jgi:hypothetical protein